MQTTTHRPARARKAAAPVYPRTNANHPGYFLACLLREQGQREALCVLTNKNGFFRQPESLQDAVYRSIANIDNQIEQSIKWVVQDGQLPFAHAQTTYFEQQVAA